MSQATAELVIHDLGRAAYGPTLRVQQRLLGEVLADAAGPERLILVEHDPPVITLGRSGGARDVLADAGELAARGVELHEVSRGGKVTWHGPGQLVGYPLCRVDRRSRDVRQFLRDIEQVLLRVLADLGVRARRREGLTGAWVGDDKIAAIGIAVRRWVSWHGFSLNVSPDLAAYQLIVPCGLADRRVTSVAGVLGRHVAVDEVKPLVIARFVEVFGFASWRPAS